MVSGADASGGVLVGVMWWYAASVLYPAQALRRFGLMPPEVLGDLPTGLPRRGLGPLFSRKQSEPKLLEHATEHDHLVEEFDRVADVYATYVRPFSRPIVDEVLDVFRRYIDPEARILEAGCGPGEALGRVARLVPDGEVVGIDLASGMVKTAHRTLLAEGLDNCAFFQADVGALPRAFSARFDLVYNCFAHHHYPDPPLATAEILRCLRPGGVYCIIDPGPEWYTRLATPLARWADPGWIGFHSPDEFRTLLLEAGFSRAGWIGLLPGFGIAVGQK
jgi:ubiquinone/menaquinone biosynthesis C-methylase UbiE